MDGEPRTRSVSEDDASEEPEETEAETDGLSVAPDAFEDEAPDKEQDESDDDGVGDSRSGENCVRARTMRCDPTGRAATKLLLEVLYRGSRSRSRSKIRLRAARSLNASAESNRSELQSSVVVVEILVVKASVVVVVVVVVLVVIACNLGNEASVG